MRLYITTLAAMIVAFTLSGCEQAVVDAEMEKLCKQDGGMKIYEKVVLPKEQFTKYGDVKFFETSNTGGGYRAVWKYEPIPVKKPLLDILTWNHANLTKSTVTVIREVDNKTLGTYISYARIGGGIVPRLGPDPSKSCPPNANSVNFLRTLFVQENQEK